MLIGASLQDPGSRYLTSFSSAYLAILSKRERLKFPVGHRAGQKPPVAVAFGSTGLDVSVYAFTYSIDHQLGVGGGNLRNFVNGSKRPALSLHSDALPNCSGNLKLLVV